MLFQGRRENGTRNDEGSYLLTRETLTSRRHLRSRSTSSPGESAVIPMISFGKETSNCSTTNEHDIIQYVFVKVGNNRACQSVSLEKD